jgi:hypothetical protein
MVSGLGLYLQSSYDPMQIKQRSLVHVISRHSSGGGGGDR